MVCFVRYTLFTLIFVIRKASLRKKLCIFFIHNPVYHIAMTLLVCVYLSSLWSGLCLYLGICLWILFFLLKLVQHGVAGCMLCWDAAMPRSVVWVLLPFKSYVVTFCLVHALECLTEIRKRPYINLTIILN